MRGSPLTFLTMREIKFRDFDYDTMQIRHFDLDTYNKYEHDSYCNIMQFIGLSNKNRVEIYEGDIVQINGNTIGEIAYYNARFVIKPVLGNVLEIIVYLDVIEVIGNIYQNPELLK